MVKAGKRKGWIKVAEVKNIIKSSHAVVKKSLKLSTAIKRFFFQIYEFTSICLNTNVLQHLKYNEYNINIIYCGVNVRNQHA